MPALQAAGIKLFYLPSYSPELNLIEPLCRHIKHGEMPVRSHKTAGELKLAVDTVLDKRATALCSLVLALDHSTNHLPEAA